MSSKKRSSPLSPKAPTGIEGFDLQALAQLAGGLAPALNDLLTVITGHASLLLDRTDADAPTRESLNQIYTAGERAVSLIRQLLLFSGRETLHAQVLDLNPRIEETGPVLRRVLGAEISVELRLADGLPPVAADAGMLEQILLGLAWNARDAMPHGGQFVVTTTTVELADADMKKFPGGRPGNFVALAVSDTGSGIAPEILPRIFEPFFTTKAAGRSTGLGLAAIFGIVQQHHGWLAVESTVGTGSTFNVFLPAAPPEARAETPERAAGKSGGGGEAILLVEDEAAVREFTTAVLQRYGYRVLQASNGTDALEVWKWHGSRIALLLTDLVLEDHMTGLDLAKKLRAAKPGLGVICTSGYGREIMARSGALPGGCHFLQKPCRPQALAGAVRAVLDGQIP